jgi:hypothetical protein
MEGWSELAMMRASPPRAKASSSPTSISHAAGLPAGASLRTRRKSNWSVVASYSSTCQQRETLCWFGANFSIHEKDNLSIWKRRTSLFVTEVPCRMYLLSTSSEYRSGFTAGLILLKSKSTRKPFSALGSSGGSQPGQRN